MAFWEHSTAGLTTSYALVLNIFLNVFEGECVFVADVYFVHLPDIPLISFGTLVAHNHRHAFAEATKVSASIHMSPRDVTRTNPYEESLLIWCEGLWV